jgi:hypothetical protein
MKRNIKITLISIGAILILLVVFVVIITKINSDNSTLSIKYTGVIDDYGNIAASGKSIPITAKTSDGFDLGVVGSLENGTLTIVIPPIPDDYLSEFEEGSSKLAIIRFGGDNYLELENNEGGIITFWFFNKPTKFEDHSFVKGWNFSYRTERLYRSLRHVYDSGYRWIFSD